MKVEDIERLWEQATKDVRAEAAPVDFVGRMADPREVRKRFARACEQHGVERAKEAGSVDLVRLSSGEVVGFRKDWSALDAEIAKENEDG